MIDCDDFYIYEPKRFDKDKIDASEEIDKILSAGFEALLWIKKKTFFSFKKIKYTRKILNKIDEYIKYNKDGNYNFGKMVKLINNNFVALNVNKFSKKQKAFADSVNNLLYKMKEDILSLYFFICGVNYGPTETGFSW